MDSHNTSIKKFQNGWHSKTLCKIPVVLCDSFTGKSDHGLIFEAVQNNEHARLALTKVAVNEESFKVIVRRDSIAAEAILNPGIL